MAVNVGSAVGYLDLDISGFLANLKAAQDEANKTSDNIATKVGNNFTSLGASITSAGSTLTKTVTLPLIGIGAAGLKVATDFEKGMSEVKAISGATGKEFDALREKAIELGADTAFSSGEVASAMTEMAKAGWNSSQIIDGMSGVLAAAAASGEGLATVSTIVADTITGFGLAASDSTRVADLLTQAANSGTIGITDLGESFKYIAPVAGAMGLSVEDVTTAISAMSMAGIKGSQAGTALRTMLTNLVNPSDNAAAVMEELGISATNADGSMKSLDEIVANLRSSFSGLTEAEKAQNAAILAGKTGMSGMLALLNLTEEEYNAIAASMDNAKGVAEETAAVMQDNLQSKFEQLGGALESLAIKMADHVIPYLQQFVEWLTKVVDKFTSLDPETQKAIIKFGLFAAAIGPVLLIVGKLTTGIGGMFTTFGKIPGMITNVQGSFAALKTGLINVNEGFTLARSGFSGLATTAGGAGTQIGAALGSITAAGAATAAAIVAAIALIVGAFVSLWNTNEEFRNNVTNIWNGIKQTFDAFAQGIVDRLNSLGFDFENITEVIKAVWEGFCNFLAPIFEGVFQQISNIFTFVTNQILNTLDFWIAVFHGNWEGAWNAIKATFENICDLIKSTFKNTVDTIINVLSKLPGEAARILLGVIEQVISWAADFVGKAKSAAEDFGSALIDGLSSIPANLASIGADMIAGVWEGISNALGGLKTNISNMASDVIGYFKSVFKIFSPSRLMAKEIGEPIGEGVAVGIINTLPVFKSYLKDFAEDFVNTAKRILRIQSGVSRIGRDELGNPLIEGIAVAFKEGTREIPEAFGKMLDELNLKKDFELLSEAEYYKELERLRNGYLEEGTAEWWDYTKQIIDYEKQVAESENEKVKAAEEASNKVLEIHSKFNEDSKKLAEEYAKNQEDLLRPFADKLAEIDLLHKTTLKLDDETLELYKLKEWDEEIEKLDNFETKLSGVSDRLKTVFNGDEDGLKKMLDIIRESPFGEGGKILDAMFEATDKDLERFVVGWQTFNQRAFDISKVSYETELQELKGNFVTDLETAFTSAKTEVAAIGENIVTGLWEGIQSKNSWLNLEIKSYAESIINKFKDEFGIHSPSTKMEKIIGKWLPPGISKGFIKTMPEAQKDMQNVFYESISKMKEKATNLLNFGAPILAADAGIGYVSYNGFSKKYVPENNGYSNDKSYPSEGDTFIFNSPKAIDEVEAAKQMKKAKRDLAEGF